MVSGFIALLVVGGFLLWVLSLQGMKGLAQWGWMKAFTAIGIAGAIPLVLSLVGLIWQNRPEAKAGAILDIVTISLAGLLIAVTIIGFGEIQLRSRALPKKITRINLVDPAKGIQINGPADADGDQVLRLAMSSDPHWGAKNCSPEARSAILRSIAAESPARDAFFILGDNADMGWNSSFWEAEAEDLKASVGTMPVRIVLGNHDGLVNGQYNYNRFAFPPPLKSDSGSPYYYSIDAGPARIFVIDLLWGTEEFDSRQQAWFEKALADTPAGKIKIVLSHCFFVSSGYIDAGTGQPWYDHKDTIAKVSPILEKYHVDLMVSGHNHYMEYLERNGVSYAVIGAMGGPLDPVPVYSSPYSKWFKQGCFGYLDLDVTVKGIDLIFRDQNGEALESVNVPARS